MLRSAGILLLLFVYCSSMAESTTDCTCKRQLIRNQVCQSDFVGIVQIFSQAFDKSLNASRYQANYVDSFRASFAIDDRSTTILALQPICGKKRLNLSLNRNPSAIEDNFYFLIAGGNRRYLTVSVCTSIAHQWHKISAYDSNKLTKEYIDKACACSPGDKSCLDSFNLDFIEDIVTF